MKLAPGASVGFVAVFSLDGSGDVEVDSRELLFVLRVFGEDPGGTSRPQPVAVRTMKRKISAPSDNRTICCLLLPEAI